MYTVALDDRVVEMLDIPPPSAGAANPVVMTNDRLTLLAYFIQEKPLTDADLKLSVAERALVAFRGCVSQMFGAPNDEAFEGHPLAGRGLHPYGVFEIEHSSWIRQLEQMNSVHPSHDRERYRRLKHFIFSFHDSTFECVASEFDVTVHRGDWQSLLAEMQARLGW